jgi:hypothetical protein
LKEIKETYLDDDLNYLFEQKGERISITMLNNGAKYLEDASIQIKIKKNEGFIIADKIYEKPVSFNPLGPSSSSFGLSYESMNYPNVTEDKGYYVIFENLGDLKHLLPKDIFEVPLRIVARGDMVGNEIAFDCQIFGKNLLKPIEIKLKLIVK